MNFHTKATATIGGDGGVVSTACGNGPAANQPGVGGARGSAMPMTSGAATADANSAVLPHGTAGKGCCEKPSASFAAGEGHSSSSGFQR